jgi:hypothetical protein
MKPPGLRPGTPTRLRDPLARHGRSPQTATRNAARSRPKPLRGRLRRALTWPTTRATQCLPSRGEPTRPRTCHHAWQVSVSFPAVVLSNSIRRASPLAVLTGLKARRICPLAAVRADLPLVWCHVQADELLTRGVQVASPRRAGHLPPDRPTSLRLLPSRKSRCHAGQGPTARGSGTKFRIDRPSDSPALRTDCRALEYR